MIFSPLPRFRFYYSPKGYIACLKFFVKSIFIKTDYVQILEKRISEFTSTKYAIAVPQARYGIYLAIKNIIKPNQEVILSPYNIYDVVNMVICAGGKPVFADVDIATGNVSTESINKLISESTGAVIATHLHGLASDINEIKELCNSKNIPLIEDAAQALGSKVNEKRSGSIGDVGIYSFGRAKNVNSFYGGMIVTNDKELALNIKEDIQNNSNESSKVLFKRIIHCLIGDFLTSAIIFPLFTFNIFKLGAISNIKSINKTVQTENNPVYRNKLPDKYKKRLTNMQAMIVLEQLRYIDRYSKERIDAASIYYEGLKDINEIRLPPSKKDYSHIYLQYPIQYSSRWDLVKYLMKSGRDVSIQHMGNCSDYQIFSRYKKNCKNAKDVSSSVVLLPTYPGYSKKEIKKNIRAIRKYFGKSSLSLK